MIRQYKRAILVLGLILAVGVGFTAARGVSQEEPQVASMEKPLRSVFLVHGVLDPSSQFVGHRVSVFGYLGVTEAESGNLMRLMPYERLDAYELGTTIDWISLLIDIPADKVSERCKGDFVVVHGTLGHVGGRPALGISTPGQGIVSYSDGKVEFCYESGGER